MKIESFRYGQITPIPRHGIIIKTKKASLAYWCSSREEMARFLRRFRRARRAVAADMERFEERYSFRYTPPVCWFMRRYRKGSLRYMACYDSEILIKSPNNKVHKYNVKSSA